MTSNTIFPLTGRVVKETSSRPSKPWHFAAVATVAAGRFFRFLEVASESSSHKGRVDLFGGAVQMFYAEFP